MSHDRLVKLLHSFQQNDVQRNSSVQYKTDRRDENNCSESVTTVQNNCTRKPTFQNAALQAKRAPVKINDKLNKAQCCYKIHAVELQSPKYPQLCQTPFCYIHHSL